MLAMLGPASTTSFGEEAVLGSLARAHLTLRDELSELVTSMPVIDGIKTEISVGLTGSSSYLGQFPCDLGQQIDSHREGIIALCR